MEQQALRVDSRLLESCITEQAFEEFRQISEVLCRYSTMSVVEL